MPGHLVLLLLGTAWAGCPAPVPVSELVISLELAEAAQADAGDVDGDGIHDLLIGAFGFDSGQQDRGATYMVRGPLSGDLSLADADARLAGASANDYSGYPVTGVGDLDADGYADVLVASLGAALAGSGPGRAHLFRGAFSGYLDLDEADAILTGESDGDHAGQGLCRAGDLDGDGRDDLLLGAPRHQVPAFGGGAVYVFFEMPQGSVSLAAADEVLAGEHAQDLAGRAVGSVPGDDGAALLVGAPGYQDGRARGAAYLIQVE